MSYVDPSQNPDQDEDQSQVDAAQNPSQQSQSSGNNQPDSSPPATSGGGGSGIVSGGNVGGGAAPPTPNSNANQPSTSGSWTNLNSYLSANEDQGQEIGSQIANTINSQGQNTQNEIQNTNQGFNQSVQNGSVTENSGAVNQAIQDASDIQVGQNLSVADQAAFDQQANASYSGPTDFTQSGGYSQAALDAGTAANTAQEAGTESGQDVLLQNQFNNASTNGYNQGEQNLDQLLLEGSGGGNAVTQAANQWSGLSNVLNNDVNTGDAAAAQAQTETQQAATDALAAFNTGRTAADTSVQNYLNNAQANYSTDFNGLQAALNGYNESGDLNLTAQEAAMLGLNTNQPLYNLYQQAGLGNMVTQAGFNAAEEITPAQQAELAALDQLGAGAGQTATNQYANAALAGTQTADNSVNASGFQQALANAGQVFNNYAGATNVTGTGTFQNPAISSSAGITAGPLSVATDQGTIASALGGGSPAFTTSGPSATQATSQAQQNYWNQLMFDLKNAGYNNVANIDDTAKPPIKVNRGANS